MTEKVSDENAKQEKQDHRIISLNLSFYPDEAEKAKCRSVVNFNNSSVFPLSCAHPLKVLQNVLSNLSVGRERKMFPGFGHSFFFVLLKKLSLGQVALKTNVQALWSPVTRHSVD